MIAVLFSLTLAPQEVDGRLAGKDVAPAARSRYRFIPGRLSPRGVTVRAASGSGSP